MININREQEVLDIGGIKLGGKIGEYPTVLIGSIFHKGDNKVKDERKGIFDKKEAERLIYLQKELSDKTGNPCMLDIVGISETALKNYIKFVTELSNDPFLLNAVSPDVRINLLKYLEEIGLIEKAIYTSINYTFTEKEYNGILKYNIESAIIQSLNPRNPRISGMISILKGKESDEGLINKAKSAGLKKILLFTSVFEVPSIGVASRGIYRLKEEFGLPTGTASIGVIGRWCINNDIFKGEIKRACETTGIALPLAMGADFIIYGTLEKAEYVFPATAIVDAMIRRNAKINFKTKFNSNDHPLHKLYFPL
jgi:tetrahydromethanopterin S-methyltransferase subunit H